MSIYDNQLLNSDLDAFKNSGSIQTASLSFSGSLSAGQMITLQTTPLDVTSPDFAQFLFDNSVKHPGSFKNLVLEGITLIGENTFTSDLACDLNVIVDNNKIKFTATLFNPYSSSITLQNTTLNFRYIPYEASF